MQGKTPTIDFDKKKLKKLKKAYDKAMKANRDTFLFEGHALFGSYAKYLIEYLDSELT